MEKVIIILRGIPGDEAWCTRLRTDVTQRLLDTGAPGLTINIRDAVVSESLMTLTTLNPPVTAVVSMWTHQCYGDQIRAAIALLSDTCEDVAAYLVTESVPLAPPQTEPGERTPGFANVALLRRPADLDEATWLARWQDDHTQVAIDTQSTFGYTQNAVVRALTEDSPPISAIVEELFPIQTAQTHKMPFQSIFSGTLARAVPDTCQIELGAAAPWAAKACSGDRPWISVWPSAPAR